MKMLKKGFTLIELLVVIAIIGILATIVVVNLSGAQKSARYRAAQENVVNATRAAATCITSEGSISNPGTSSTGNICSNDATLGVWPVLPTGFAYAAGNGAIDNTFTFDVTADATRSLTGSIVTAVCSFQGCTGF